ncbi:MAG TPA: response regulator transcription factor [Edaphobacter sp.]|nr:response regulator transcription factor [Edaphobacter sp.]HTF69749.1 response regulator transcription factor [Edaphobacter sp.]
MRVLLVEDDATVSSLLERALSEEGDFVVLAQDGASAVELAQGEPFDAIVLDVMLPRLDGFHVTRRLREDGCHTPILMLTARDADRDVVQGLNLGANDYLTKPFSLDVFFARLRAVVRRGGLPLSLSLAAGGLQLSTATREVQRGSRKLQLTRTEFGLLELLLRNRGRVIPRERIIEMVWGHGPDIEDNTLDAFVHSLRSKVDGPGEPKLIHTVRGVGYTLREPA